MVKKVKSAENGGNGKSGNAKTKGGAPCFDEFEATSEVKHSLPLLTVRYSKEVADTTSAQMNARITRLRAAQLFLEACSMESTNDSKIPGILFEHELIANYDGRYFVKTKVTSEKTLTGILKSRLTGGPECSLNNLSKRELEGLKEHVRILNKSVSDRVSVILNPVYLSPKK